MYRLKLEPRRQEGRTMNAESLRAHIVSRGTSDQRYDIEALGNGEFVLTSENRQLLEGIKAKVRMIFFSDPVIDMNFEPTRQRVAPRR